MLIFTDMKTNLKPCPLCGCKNVEINDMYVRYRYCVWCIDCNCRITGPNKKDLVKRWNTRNDEMTLKKVLLLIPELAIKILALAVLAAGVYWIFA